MENTKKLQNLNICKKYSKNIVQTNKKGVKIKKQYRVKWII